ncbi:PREDICTED: uncharacterized protein LOC105973899 [Erythranthe guttata]|uniref:uncharacterized protein LOC105973899 n=1 Tax=Erythranthe guttata TaxID=4155 RepID=UPI00064D8BD4|nr:PREDICTED: uncharacterized protein LOC105973899 [Erythranthe guttata]|eukprot:XP_012854394.1 PREDICTED: uncharacterized protein LOC105973899 [Erythranthe guttata]
MENQTPLNTTIPPQTISAEPTLVSTTPQMMTQRDSFSNGGNLISLNASSQIPFKLAKNGVSYASWKSQMTNLLFGYGLLGFVDGTHPCLLPTDPEYIYWTRQDRLVLFSIQATVNSTISPTINNCTTFADAWNKLETSFANRSNTRMLSIMSSLMTNKKEGKTVAAYMSRVKNLVDDLALIGHPLNDSQVMSYALNGLGDEFKELTAAVRVRDTPLSFEDLYDKLLDEELIRNNGELKDEEVQITAQFTQKQAMYKNCGTRGGHRGGNNSSSHNSHNTPSHMHFNRQQQPSSGRGIRSSNFQPHFSSWNSNSYQGNQSQHRIVCQLCDKPGHSAKTCYSREQPSSQLSRPHANLAERDTTHNNKNWVLDSGATHHITSDLQNLSMHSNYVGNEDVVVGNGNEIPISHIGSGSINSHGSSFALNNVLCAPLIKKNLISVSQFCKQNNVSIEFFANYFLVKDLNTRASLAKGRSRHNLYE